MFSVSLYNILLRGNHALYRDPHFQTIHGEIFSFKDSVLHTKEAGTADGVEVVSPDLAETR